MTGPGPRTIVHDNVASLVQFLTAPTRDHKAYRGHGDSDWHLEPSVIRNKRYQYRREQEDAREDSVPLENHFLQLFVDACDKAGLPVSGDGDKLRQFLEDPVAIENLEGNGQEDLVGRHWPGDSNEMLSLMAQAQHYGVPTRLLDWTTAPLVAAYFAASSALKAWTRHPARDRLRRKLSVWELNISASEHFPRKFEIKRAPGSVSAHLPAQRGLFTLLKGNNIPNLRLEEHPHSSEFLTRHDIPIHCLPELMRECDRHGHSAATLFPDYEGAARHAEERFLISELSQALKEPG